MKVLLPIDGSATSNEAVEFVRALAVQTPVEVIALTIWYDPTHNTMQPWASEWKEYESNRTQKILNDASKQLKDVCQSVTVLCEPGSTAHAILERARQSEVDLIVMGAKGHSTVDRILLGSVSDTVATNAKCSVVVIRPSAEGTRVSDKVLLGYDKSVASREAVTELLQWNFPRDTQVSVISVAVEPFMFVGDGFAPPIVIDPKHAQKIDEAAERMASQIAEHFPHTNVSSPTSDHVGQAIVTQAEAEKSTLVVLGDSGQGLFGHFLMGSTSKYVLRHVHCSVWISRHHWNTPSKPKEIADAVAAT